MDVSLAGSNSSDPDGNFPLTYAWSFVSQPAGSAAVLRTPTEVNSSFTADFSGDYVVQLVVTDSLGAVSAPDTVTISTVNTAPEANAGADIAVTLMATNVVLDGSQSFDIDGHAITYDWSVISQPVGSSIVLTNATIANPSFFADLYGDYIFSLIVTDEFGAGSAPDAVTVSFNNVAPVANAGSSRTVVMGDTIVLNGLASTDASNDPLSYQWSIVNAPLGSVSAIVDPAASVTNLTLNTAGTYIIGLTVNDGEADSLASNITVLALTFQDASTANVQDFVTLVNNLNPSVFMRAKFQEVFVKKALQGLRKIDKGDYLGANDKLRWILRKVDGCATQGSPDKDDWITNCQDQALPYQLITESMQLVGNLF